MYYVYVLKNKKTQELYIGYSDNLKRRIKQHQKNYPNQNLIYYEAYLSEENARNREKQLKYYGSAWRALRKRINA